MTNVKELGNGDRELLAHIMFNLGEDMVACAKQLSAQDERNAEGLRDVGCEFITRGVQLKLSSN